MFQVTKLKSENEKLEEKVKLLSKELDFLKNLFLTHAGETFFESIFVEQGQIHVRDFLNWIHDIQDKTPCIALTLFKHKNGRVE
jgi:hypothetical protein